MRVPEQLLFLARLNGLAKQDAENELTGWLERFQISANRKASWLEQLAGVQVTKRREDYIEMHIQAHLNPNVIVEAALFRSFSIEKEE